MPKRTNHRLPPNWLQEELAAVEAESKRWPGWMKENFKELMRQVNAAAAEYE